MTEYADTRASVVVNHFVSEAQASCSSHLPKADYAEMTQRLTDESIPRARYISTKTRPKRAK